MPNYHDWRKSPYSHGARETHMPRIGKPTKGELEAQIEALGQGLEALAPVGELTFTPYDLLRLVAWWDTSNTGGSIGRAGVQIELRRVAVLFQHTIVVAGPDTGHTGPRLDLFQADPHLGHTPFTPDVAAGATVRGSSFLSGGTAPGIELFLSASIVEFIQKLGGLVPPFMNWDVYVRLYDLSSVESQVVKEWKFVNPFVLLAGKIVANIEASGGASLDVALVR